MLFSLSKCRAPRLIGDGLWLGALLSDFVDGELWAAPPKQSSAALGREAPLCPLFKIRDRPQRLTEFSFCSRRAGSRM